MARYTIDAPTLVRLASGGVELDTRHQLVAPSAIRSDALQLLLDDVLRGVREDGDVRAIHERVTEIKLRVLGDRVSRWTAWKIARERGWDSIADAEYMAITRLQADALVTVDPRLRAKAKGVVPQAPLRALLR